MTENILSDDEHSLQDISAIVIGNATLYLGDCIEVMKTMPDNSVDSVVTDPPYELGFMGKKWDSTGIANNLIMWAECLRVLKPGGHLLAFGGSRTYHRMVCAVEDAGFEVRDQIMWVYGSGFPKSLNVSKAIDKAAGAERIVVSEGKPVKRMIPGADQDATGSWIKNNGREYVPQTDEARQWDGWGTALKPAHEPIVVARKALIGTVVENALAWGTGAININDCRIAAPEGVATIKHNPNGVSGFGSSGISGGTHGGFQTKGRWPANFIHDGSDEVVASFPSQAGASAPVRGTEASAASISRVTSERERVAGSFHGDKGSAARFFYCAKACPADRHSGLGEIVPQFKCGSLLHDAENLTDRNGNHHPTVKPTDLMAYLIRLVTPACGTVLDPFMGSGSTGKAATRENMQFIGIELDPDYVAIAQARIKHEQTMAETAQAVEDEQLSLFDSQEVAA
ncbi:DNA-methyltransferase [Undibacterium sp. TJN19]|uniref:DNA-methyltransferase n=1 Tax=Undibacterium sp. TJN19 TaxID=3413055 RepID=UPI003BF1AB5D